MSELSLIERRLIISNTSKNIIPYLNTINTVFPQRKNLIKTIKTYIKKYYNYASNKNNILYLSILYLDIIISKEKISLKYDKNLKYLCLCCFLLSLKFLGDFDISKKIIRNFCDNYKEEYKIFEIQCIELLEYNLIYTTAYDYINIIFNIKEQKKLLNICNNILYKICENELYLFYSPFYIAITVIQLSKNYLNEYSSYNHYDKYFQDQRVKFLYQNFSYLINNNTNNNTNNNKITIYTNNNIQNNIVIINEISKENENKENININIPKNKTPFKINVNRFNKKNKNNYIKVEKNIINNNDINYNNNTYRITRIRNNKSKNNNNLRYINSFNNMINYTSIKSINKENKNNNLTITNNNSNSNNILIKNQNKSSTNLKSKVMYSNKSSLNFKLLSNIPKDVLYKLSRNLSKNLVSPFDKITVNKKTKII